MIKVNSSLGYLVFSALVAGIISCGGQVIEEAPAPESPIPQDTEVPIPTPLPEPTEQVPTVDPGSGGVDLVQIETIQLQVERPAEVPADIPKHLMWGAPGAGPDDDDDEVEPTATSLPPSDIFSIPGWEPNEQIRILVYQDRGVGGFVASFLSEHFVSANDKGELIFELEGIGGPKTVLYAIGKETGCLMFNNVHGYFQAKSHGYCRTFLWEEYEPFDDWKYIEP